MGNMKILEIVVREVLLANEWSDLTVVDITGTERASRILAARCEVVFLLNKLSFPLDEIAELLHKRHATIVHDIRAIREQVEASSEMSAKLEGVWRKVCLEINERKV